jgi:hypothetical protein
MNTFLEELKEYFDTTSKEKVKVDWAKYDTEENNVGPTVADFLDSCSYYHFSSNYPIDIETFQIENKNLSPEFSSGFLLPILFPIND